MHAKIAAIVLATIDAESIDPIAVYISWHPVHDVHRTLNVQNVHRIFSGVVARLRTSAKAIHNGAHEEMDMQRAELTSDLVIVSGITNESF